jgi:hypothetical protein
MKNLLLLIILVSICMMPGANARDVKLLQGVNLIDGRGNYFPDVDILIEGDIITGIGPTGSLRAPDSAEIFDLKGKFVIPGLIDTHVHLGMRGFSRSPKLIRQEFTRWIYSGVTTVREMGGDARLLAYEKRLIDLREIDGPDIYYSATYGSVDMVDKDPRPMKSALGIGVKKASWMQSVYEGRDYARSVSRAKGILASGIKIYMGVEAHNIKELTKEANRQGLKSWCHFTVFPDRPIDVVKAGVDVVSHVWGAFWQHPGVDQSERIPFTHTDARNVQDDFKKHMNTSEKNQGSVSSFQINLELELDPLEFKRLQD